MYFVERADCLTEFRRWGTIIMNGTQNQIDVRDQFTKHKTRILINSAIPVVYYNVHRFAPGRCRLIPLQAKSCIIVQDTITALS